MDPAITKRALRIVDAPLMSIIGVSQLRVNFIISSGLLENRSQLCLHDLLRNLCNASSLTGQLNLCLNLKSSLEACETQIITSVRALPGPLQAEALIMRNEGAETASIIWNVIFTQWGASLLYIERQDDIRFVLGL